MIICSILKILQRRRPLELFSSFSSLSSDPATHNIHTAPPKQSFIMISLYYLLAISFILLPSPSVSWSQEGSNSLSRRRWMERSSLLLSGAAVASTSSPKATYAAPPISVIAEELGYFPVQNRDGDVMYIPKKVQRPSTDQAVELAKKMKEKGISMYGTFWCPHCSRQKELFGKEAWSYLDYVECSPKGYGFKGTCKNVDGYPTFRDNRGKIVFSGERPLEFWAQQVGFTDFDPSLEGELPAVGAECRLRQ